MSAAHPSHSAHPAPTGPGRTTLKDRLAAMPNRSEVMDAIADYVPGMRRRPAKFITEDGRRVYGVIAEYKDPAAVYHAAETFRDAGYRNWDVYAPFPIHGIDRAIGVHRTILPIIVAVAGFSGAGLGFLLQWGIKMDYPLPVQGKPYGAWEQFVPVMFEMGVLPSAFAALIGMLALNGLPRWNHPLFSSDRFLKVSDDRFLIAVQANDPKFDPEATRALLEQTGGFEIDLVEEEE